MKISRVVFGPHSLYSLDWSLALCFSGLAALMAFPARSNYSQENDSGLPDRWKFRYWILSKLMHKLIEAAGRACSSRIPPAICAAVASRILHSNAGVLWTVNRCVIYLRVYGILWLNNWSRLQGWMSRQSGLRAEGLSVAERRVGNRATVWKDKRVQGKYVKRGEDLTDAQNNSFWLQSSIWKKRGRSM